VASPAEAPAPRGNVVLLVVLSLVAFGFAKLPWLVRGLDAATYLGRNGGFLATVPLALWVAYARATRAGARALVVVLSAGLLLHANLALHRPGDANVLALMHLPILQWTLVALAFLGDGWRERGRRVEFVRFGTELVIFTLLLTGGGVILTGLTLWLFGMVGTHLGDWYVKNVVPWGLVAAPLVAAYIDSRRRGQASRLGPRVAAAFQPLLLLTLAPFVGLVLYRGAAAYQQREFLSAVNAVVVTVAWAILATLCEGGRSPRRTVIDALTLALVAVTVVLDGVALWAIVGRIRSLGWWPSRVAVLGTNLAILGCLAGVGWRQLGFLRGRSPLAAVQAWIAAYLPVFAIWGGMVVLILPLALTERAFTGRLRAARPSVEDACVYVTEVSDIAAVSTRSHALAATIDVINGTPYGIVAAPDGSRLYLPHEGGRPEVIDTATARSLACAPGPEYARHLVLAGDGRLAYGSGRDRVTLVDIDSGAVFAQRGLAAAGDIALAGPSLFVAAKDDLIVLDRETLEVRRRVPLPFAGRLAATPDGTRVLVTRYGANAVSVIDAASAQVVRTIAIPPADGQNPYHVVLRPDGRSAWVLADEPTPGPLGLILRGQWESRLIEIGLAGGDILRTIAAEHSLGLALSTDGQRIYLPQGFSRRVTVLAGGSFEEKITVPGFAYGVAFVPRPCVVDASPSKPRLPIITRNTCREAGPPPDALSRH